MTDTVNDTIEAIRDITESRMSARLKVISIEAILNVIDSIEDEKYNLDALPMNEPSTLNGSVSVVRTDKLRALEDQMRDGGLLNVASKINQLAKDHAYLIGA